jgi:tRNA modification GTPase
MSLSGKLLSPNLSDTISAIATAPGLAGISVIRISGSKAISIADKIFTGKIRPSQTKSHTVHFGKIADPTTKKILDEVLLTVFLTPHSYTGENMIEISCHGGDFVASAILKLIIKLGARLAEPGEFTKRRVLNGRMDITQAEAVLDLVSAKTEATYKSALDQLQGKLTGYIQNLTNELTTILAQMENLLEFEEDQQTELPRLTNRIRKISINLKETIEKNTQLQFLRTGIYCVIIGRPNVGKSSLFNRLTEMDRSIVTEIPGTTRDSLEQTVTLHGITFHLIDTAGLKVITKPKGAQKIEAMGIEKSKNWLEAADFVLAVFDNSQPTNKQDNLVYNVVKNKPHLLVLNKIDLRPKFNHKLFNHKTIYPVSAKFNKGITRLKTAMVKFYAKRIPSASNNYLYLNTRHIDVLNRVDELLKQSIQENYLDVSIIHLRDALDILGTVTNAVTNEQILDSIFTQFCIGK